MTQHVTGTCSEETQEGERGWGKESDWARGQTRVNITLAFTHQLELKEVRGRKGFCCWTSR